MPEFCDADELWLDQNGRLAHPDNRDNEKSGLTNALDNEPVPVATFVRSVVQLKIL